MLQIQDLSNKQILDVVRNNLHPFKSYIESLDKDTNTITVSFTCDCESIGSCDRCDIQQVIENVSCSLGVSLENITIGPWSSFFVEDSGCETCGHGQIPNRFSITVKVDVSALFQRSCVSSVLHSIHQDMMKKRMEQERQHRKAEAKRREEAAKARAAQNRRAGMANLSEACEKVSVASASAMSDRQFASFVESLSPPTKALAFSIRKRGTECGIKAHIAKYGEDSIVYY